MSEAGGEVKVKGVQGKGSACEVARVFLKLGAIAFGGPAAHIAMMHDEACRRRGWVSEERFLDLLGAANMIPGPSSTEMALYLGYERAGWRGLVAGGACFILPAMVIVMALAWAYVRYGSAPEAAWLLYGIKPVVVAVIVQALWKLLRTAVKGPLLAGAGAARALLSISRDSTLYSSSSAAAFSRWSSETDGACVPAAGAPAIVLPALGLPAAAAASFSLASLFLTCLKIGSVVFGSGYVLLAFLRADFVQRLGWLNGPTDPRRRRRGPVHAGAGLYHRYVHRVPAGRRTGRPGRDGRDIPSLILFYGRSLPRCRSFAPLCLGGRIPGRRQRGGPRPHGGRHMAARPRRPHRPAYPRAGGSFPRSPVPAAGSTPRG